MPLHFCLPEWTRAWQLSSVCVCSNKHTTLSLNTFTGPSYPPPCLPAATAAWKGKAHTHQVKSRALRIHCHSTGHPPTAPLDQLGTQACFPITWAKAGSPPRPHRALIQTCQGKRSPSTFVKLPSTRDHHGHHHSSITINDKPAPPPPPAPTE